MRCKKCGNNAIDIYCDGDKYIVECQDCGGGKVIPREVAEMIRYNIEIDNAEQDGYNMYSNSTIDDNPFLFSTDGSDELLSNAWERGWDRANLESEILALEFSAEKNIANLKLINIKLEEVLKEKNKDQAYITLVKLWLNYIVNEKYWFGSKYRKSIDNFKIDLKWSEK